MEFAPKILFSRKEASELLSLSVSSLQVMIARGMLKITRKGRRVLIHRAEIERLSRQDIPRIWPAKFEGKTSRWSVKFLMERRAELCRKSEQGPQSC